MDKGKQRAVHGDDDDHDNVQDDPSSPRSFAHLAALSHRLDEFCKQPNEHDLAYLQATLDIYQSASYLLEPHLHTLSDQPLQAFRRAVLDDPKSRTPTLLARYLYWLSKVVLPKQLVRYFPHGTTDLQLLLHLVDSPSFAESAWETRYIALLWLSLVVSIPFALDRFGKDSSAAIEACIKGWLACPGKEREAAATLAARFYGRKDVSQERLLDFLQWAEDTLHSPDEEEKAGSKNFLAAGLLQFLCAFVKAATRQSLSASLFGRLYNLSSLFQPGNLDVDVKSPLIRRLLAKYHGRLAAAYLPLSVSTSHGRRSTTLPTALMGRPAEVHAAPSIEEDFDVPEEVEVLVGDLLEMISDQDSRVRWTVSKALARISGQLPISFIDQIVSALLALYPSNILHLNSTIPGKEEDLSLVSASTWHGTTLCLASFLRNTLLSPTQVQECLPWILRALTFSQRKGSQKIGANIRDAACYFIWCAARASSKQPNLLTAHDVHALARKLIVVACTDEEVSGRRAASAAFQECVGRLDSSSVPHGLEVLVMMDAYIVGVRRSAFLEAAPNVAQFVEYREALVSHMQEKTLKHPDRQMRELAAMSLGKILAGSEKDLQDPAGKAIAALASATQAAHVHGQLLLLVEIARLSSSEQKGQILRSLADIPQSFLSGSSVALLLPTVAQLITACLAHHSGNAEQMLEIDHKATWRRFVEVAQKRFEASSHEAAASIVSAISSTFDILSDLKATLRTLKITTSFITQQCVTKMLGAFDYSRSSTCRELLDIVVDRLLKVLDPKNVPTFKTIEAKRNALDSLGTICATYHEDEKVDVDLIVNALKAGLGDYTFDERGDVGSIVRMTCMKRMTDVCLVFSRDALVDELFHLLLKQSVERMDNVRDVAGQQLIRLQAAGKLSIPALPEEWRSLSVTLPYVLDLLLTLEDPLVPLLGIVTVAGSPPEITQIGAKVVLDWLKKEDPAMSPKDLARMLLSILETPKTPNRILIPTFHLLALLLEEGMLMEDQESLDSLMEQAKKSVDSSKVKGRVMAAARAFMALASNARLREKACKLLTRLRLNTELAGELENQAQRACVSPDVTRLLVDQVCQQDP